MGHLSVAADDYLLTGQVGGGPGRQGRAGGAAPAPWDLWQLSAARFSDRSSGLEFIWVTVTGGVCCDKRLMGRAAWTPAVWEEGELGCLHCRCPVLIPD